MIAALCCERDSPEQLTDECKREKRAVTDRDIDTLYDFCDRGLFKRKYGQYLRNWDEELYILFTFSSYGYKYKWEDTVVFGPPGLLSLLFSIWIQNVV